MSVLGDSVPAAIEAALAEGSLAFELLVVAGALVGTSIRSGPEESHGGDK